MQSVDDQCLGAVGKQQDTELMMSWNRVVQSIAVVQQDGTSHMSPPSFIYRCTQERALSQHLDTICQCQLYDLLLAWVMESVRHYLSSHVVPKFWSHYRKCAITRPAVQRCPMPNRQCQSSFFAAVQELNKCMPFAVDLHLPLPHCGPFHLNTSLHCIAGTLMSSCKR